MSDPFKDAMHRRHAEKVRRIAETHEPITVFVESGIDSHEIRKYVEEMLIEIPGVSVASKYDEPSYEIDIRT